MKTKRLSVWSRLRRTVTRRFNMAFATVRSVFSRYYLENAWHISKFMLSIATGFFIFCVSHFLYDDQDVLHVYLSLMSCLICGILFGVEKCVDDGGLVTSQGIGSQKRRVRRDGEDDGPSNEDETTPGPKESRPDSSVALESPRKNCRRQKKKRNSLKSNKSKYKGAMDDSSETSSSNNESYPKTETRVEKTKVYLPLSQFLKLNLELYDLYHEFKPFLLSLDQLKMYGFPRESPDHPGRITPDPNLVKGSTQRRCCRCGKSFTVLADGQYKADSSCRYHPRKQTPYRKDNSYSGSFPCCNGNYMSEGCTTWQYHVSAESFLHDVDFVKARSKRHLNDVTASTVYAVDCEMLFTTAGMEVAKVGIVGVDGLTVYESFVLPQNPILDYNTLYSGVSEKDLKGVRTTLVDVQAFLLKLLNKDSILVGHGLENDLKALRLIHEKVVDTSVAFPLPYSKIYKKSLKVLAKEFLNKQIQQSLNGHDCIEDARTCMELMLLKISTELKTRLPLAQDENRNILPVMHLPTAPVQNYFSYDSNYSYYSNSFGDNFSEFYMPKKYYQKNCMY